MYSGQNPPGRLSDYGPPDIAECPCVDGEPCYEHNKYGDSWFLTTDGCSNCENDYSVATADAQCRWCDNIAGRLYFDSWEELLEYYEGL